MNIDKNLAIPLAEKMMDNGVTLMDAWNVYSAYSNGKVDIVALQKGGTLTHILAAGAKIAADPTDGPKLASFLSGLMS